MTTESYGVRDLVGRLKDPPEVDWRDRVAESGWLVGGASKLLPGIVVDMAGASEVRVALPRGIVIEARPVEEIPAAWVAQVVRARESSP